MSCDAAERRPVKGFIGRRSADPPPTLATIVSAEVPVAELAREPAAPCSLCIIPFTVLGFARAFPTYASALSISRVARGFLELSLLFST